MTIGDRTLTPAQWDVARELYASAKPARDGEGMKVVPADAVVLEAPLALALLDYIGGRPYSIRNQQVAQAVVRAIRAQLAAKPGVEPGT